MTAAMPGTPPRSKIGSITPLGIIATFVALSESVAGLAAIRTQNAVQLIFAVFAVTFPVLIAGVFFAVLWKRAYVFYSPQEFGHEVDVNRYVEAMRSQAIGNNEIIAIVRSSITEALESKEAHAVLTHVGSLGDDVGERGMQKASEVLIQQAVESLHSSLVSVDLSAFSVAACLLAYKPDESAFTFLSAIYYQIADHVDAFTYGESWALRDTVSGQLMLPVNVDWRDVDALANSQLSVREFGIQAGMEVKAVRLSDRAAAIPRRVERV